MTDADHNGMDCHPNIPMECFCQSAICRKTITGNDWQLPYLQEKYIGYFSDYIQDLINQMRLGKTFPKFSDPRA